MNGLPDRSPGFGTMPSFGAGSLREMTAGGWFFALAFCAVALAASSFRIVLAPGIELFLGPFFYFMAYRVGGLRLAIPMVLLTMAPSFFWWGHGYTILLSLGQVLFIDRFRSIGRSLAISTIVFYTTIGAAAAYIFFQLYYDASSTIIVLRIIRRLLNDVMMASLVDLAVSLLSVKIRTGRIVAKRTVELAELLPASITLIVVASTLVLFIGNVKRWPQDLNAYRAETELQVQLHIGRSLFRQEPFLGLVNLRKEGIASQKVVISDNASELRGTDTMQQIGCQQIDDGLQGSGTRDRTSFAFWFSACHLAGVKIADRQFFYLYSTRPLAESAYRNVLRQMFAPGILLLFAILMQLFLTRAMNQSLRAWKEVAEGFGRSGLTAPGSLSFAEFERPIAAIVSANNRFATLMDERKRLAQAVEELKAQMDLSLAAHITFDAETCTLNFQDISTDRTAQMRSVKVHPNDCMAFSENRDATEAFVEFRLADDDSNDWYLLVARGQLAPGHWRSGWIVRLRQSKLAQNRMLQQARLVELGGMASALSHELKQPLFTISLCAENGRLLLDQADEEGTSRVYGKLDRISEQVHRARDIIGRISRYARIEDSEPEVLDLSEVIAATLIFMRPLLVQHDVGVNIAQPDGPPIRVIAPRVGLEQVLVNAIQNSVDSIAMRREAEGGELDGMIDLTVALVQSGLRISVTDNGGGLSLSHPQAAFDAFTTTKDSDRGTGLGLYISRQIVMEIGGSISITSRQPPERGAILTIDFPEFVVLSSDTDSSALDGEAVDAQA
tara:strand:+ start:988 stop:3342 length:2355 start_codon:yes stop_codon:yes gene_type:complete